jgi:hypothetical protein
MLQYLHDSIFVNKIKEKLYKIYTRALPVGKKLQGPNVSQACCFCGLLEDELHCFVHCIRLRPLWLWLIACFGAFGWIEHISDAERLLGYVHSHRFAASMAVWKLAHAEFIRIIWYTRCRKYHDNEDFDLEAMKSMIRSRIQASYHIYEAGVNMKNAAKCMRIRALWKQAFLASSMKNGRLKLSIP